ncbi:MAG: NupC/NupG family nucleoside CNT transporter, partial [Planctomycetota bacterium]
RVSLKIVAVGLALQLAIAAVLLYVPGSQWIFAKLTSVVEVLMEATLAGTTFVFGYIGGGPPPFEIDNPNNMVIFGLQALPLMLLLAALTSLLFYWKVLPAIIHGFSWLLRKTMNINGCEGVSAAANVFVGMIEAPLFIAPYIKGLTRSQLFTVMSCGMATIAGTVMVLYAQILGNAFAGESVLGHLLVASLISPPAAILVAKVMVPETEHVEEVEPPIISEARGSMDAIVQGIGNGTKLFIHVVATLIVFVALVYLVNVILYQLPFFEGDRFNPATGGGALQWMLGWIMAPVVWLIGVPWSEATTAGSLMGVKTVLNEFLAYLQLAGTGDALSPRSRMIMVYAMCGFANFGSLGIMVGGLTALAPERRSEIVGLGLKTIVSGTIATLMTGAVIGAIGPF